MARFPTSLLFASAALLVAGQSPSATGVATSTVVVTPVEIVAPFETSTDESDLGEVPDPTETDFDDEPIATEEANASANATTSAATVTTSLSTNTNLTSSDVVLDESTSTAVETTAVDTTSLTAVASLAETTSMASTPNTTNSSSATESTRSSSSYSSSTSTSVASGSGTTLVTSTKPSASTAGQSPTSLPGGQSVHACPDGNGAEYSAPSGQVFLLACSTDHNGGDMPNGLVYIDHENDIEACILECDEKAGCVDVALTGTACYLKSAFGGARASNNVNSAKVINSTPAHVLGCPDDNGVQYTSPNGKKFEVECGVDHSGGDMGGPVYVPKDNLTACIEQCDLIPDCVDASLNTQACYLKKFLGNAVTAPHIWGAKLVGAEPPFSCPSADGKNYTANGKTYVVECGIDYATSQSQLIGGEGTVIADDEYPWLQPCLELCAGTTNCVNIALSGNTCYLKSSTNATVVQNPDVSGARQIYPVPVEAPVPSPTPSPPTAAVCNTTAPVCPACDGKTVSGPKKDLKISCNTDVPGGDYDELDVGPGGQGFKACIDKCTSATFCRSVAFQGAGCYLKNTVGPTTTSDGVWVAILA